MRQVPRVSIDPSTATPAEDRTVTSLRAVSSSYSPMRAAPGGVGSHHSTLPSPEAYVISLACAAEVYPNYSVVAAARGNSTSCSKQQPGSSPREVSLSNSMLRKQNP